MSLTLEEIIRMALEAGVVADEDNGYLELWNFAKLVAAHEREACAKVCDELKEVHCTLPEDCAAAIRARGCK